MLKEESLLTIINININDTLITSDTLILLRKHVVANIGELWKALVHKMRLMRHARRNYFSHGKVIKTYLHYDGQHNRNDIDRYFLSRWSSLGTSAASWRCYSRECLRLWLQSIKTISGHYPLWLLLSFSVCLSPICLSYFPNPSIL